MITKRALIFIVLAFGIIFSAAFFITGSNDHKECGTVVKKEVDKNGNKVTIEEHICKEKYSF